MENERLLEKEQTAIPEPENAVSVKAMMEAHLYTSMPLKKSKKNRHRSIHRVPTAIIGKIVPIKPT